MLSSTPPRNIEIAKALDDFGVDYVSHCGRVLQT